MMKFKKNKFGVLAASLIAVAMALFFSLSMACAAVNPEIEFSKFISTLDKNNVFSISKATAQYQSLFGPIKDEKVKMNGYRQWQKYYEAVRMSQNQFIASKNDQLLNEGLKPSLATKALWSSLKYNG